MEILGFLENGFKTYVSFRKERFQEKNRRVTDTIKRVNIPNFVSKEEKAKKESTTQSVKIASTLIGKVQKNMEIARARGFTNKNLLQYDLLDCPLFDETGLARHRKQELMTQLKALYQMKTTVTTKLVH